MRVVAALGGNAFAPHGPGRAPTMEDQFVFARRTLEAFVPLLRPEVQLLIGHGNGPQVGHMLLRSEAAHDHAYPLPLDICVATTQGELGSVLVRSLHDVLAAHRLNRSVAALVSHVLVDPADPAFCRPDKPVGPFYDDTRAEELKAQGLALRPDPGGRGHRRVVPSPEPLEILDLPVIRGLLASGAVVIAGGGGGVPLVRREAGLTGVEAVVDKDHTAALLAASLDASLLVIVTDVPCAYTDYRTPTEAPIGRVTASALTRLLAEGHFAPGSMKPKMEACARFVSRPGRRAVVCDVAGVSHALAGDAGTVVVPG